MVKHKKKLSRENSLLKETEHQGPKETNKSLKYDTRWQDALWPQTKTQTLTNQVSDFTLK